MSATENIVRADLALGARLRVAELPDVQAMHRMETTLFPADAWHIDMFLEELTHPTRTYYILELPAENQENSEGGWRTIGYCGTMVVADTADVQTIGVLPEYEGHGFGRAMLEQMHERALRGRNRRHHHGMRVLDSPVFPSFLSYFLHHSIYYARPA